MSSKTLARSGASLIRQLFNPFLHQKSSSSHDVFFQSSEILYPHGLPSLLFFLPDGSLKRNFMAYVLEVLCGLDMIDFLDIQLGSWDGDTASVYYLAHSWFDQCGYYLTTFSSTSPLRGS
ncbi:hypothetical protein HHK36_017083 [Tetracentron sinense]|uniref:Uncharacterized protein n=1 Tax=Tetracentron sinense TaxID=13715 RepID=A0A834Z1U5_TETSI|nr:hypothetical protein HHK36_017083 [Tetracentron sinense]